MVDEDGDIRLLKFSPETVYLKALSIHGMLWLQTHFHDDDWDAIAEGKVGLDYDSADKLSQDAGMAGLLVIYN